MKAIIFDMDGVIVDTEALHAKTKVAILAQYGIDCQEEECLPYRGRSSDDFFREYLAKHQRQIPLREIVAKKHQTFLQQLKTGANIEPIPGVLKLIHELHAAKMRLALASSSARANIEFFLQQFKIYDFFEIIASGAELPLSKPDPTIYLETIAALGLDASDCAVIEDSTAGILAAKRAGAYCIAYRDPRYLAYAQDISEADWQISDFGELSAQKLFSLQV